MSSRRNLKKDINSLCYGIISECFTFLDHSPSLNQENVQVIIHEAVELRNRLICRINKPEPEDISPAGARVYYRNIKNELCGKATGLIERLNNLPR